MLALRICPSSFSSAFSPSKHLRHPHSSFFKPRSINISCSAQTIEHVVLFNVKDGTEPSKVNAMVNDLSSLVTLDNVLYLTVGAILRHSHTTTAVEKPSPELHFTHMLHSRYSTKEHLEAYSAHPKHLSVVRGSVLPICDDLMAVDWVRSGGGGSTLPVPPRGSAIRVRFLKLKEDGEEEDEAKVKVLEVAAGGIEGGEMVQLSCGENFSPARAKGFSVATLAVFPGQRELERMGLGLEKVKEHVDSELVVDYVVP